MTGTFKPNPHHELMRRDGVTWIVRAIQQTFAGHDATAHLTIVLALGEDDWTKLAEIATALFRADAKARNLEPHDIHAKPNGTIRDLVVAEFRRLAKGA